MAGTRTAPAFTGTATARRISMQLVDASGDTFSESFYVDVAETDANIEALIAAYQAASQASVYATEDVFVYIGEQDPDNAETDQRNSVKDGINLLFKDGVNGLGLRLVAPIPEVLQGNQDIPLLTATAATNLITAAGTVFAPYALESAQYTERRERKNNPRIKA